MNIIELDNKHDIRECHALMLQLRPHLKNVDDFATQVERQRSEGYHLVGIKENTFKALAGYRFSTFLAWGKVLYIDDLVCHEDEKRKGYGGLLLRWIIEEARKAACDQVHLDSGSHRHDAHRLYLNHGFKIIGHHFSLNFHDPDYISARLRGLRS